MKRLHLFVRIAHIAGWLIFLSFPVVFMTNNDSISFTDVISSPYYWLCFLFYATVFYFHTYLFISFLYRREMRFYYFIIVVLLFVSAFWLRPFDHMSHPGNRRSVQVPNNKPPPFEGNNSHSPFHPPPDSPFRPHDPPPNHYERSSKPREHFIDVISILMLILIISISFGVDTFKRFRYSVQLAANAEVDKANAELSFLKAQINPHFLFNTLNNIYSLALTNSTHTAESILKLSDIMRYVTEEVDEHRVPLQKEIKCIEDFLDLQRLRISRKTIIEYTTEGDMSCKIIPPLLFLTFVENTFKYGISNHLSSTITIRIASLPRSIDFFCSNPILKKENDKTKGTGIINSKKRLAYLYPDRHRIDISLKENIFTVHIVLED